MTESNAALRARQYYQQGVSFFQRGELIEADEALRGALRTTPGHIDARIQLAKVLLRRGRANEGLHVLNGGLSQDGTSEVDRARLLETAAACASNAGEYDVARGYLEDALDLGRSGSAQVLNKVAAVSCKGGEFQTGFDYFLKAARKKK